MKTAEIWRAYWERGCFIILLFTCLFLASCERGGKIANTGDEVGERLFPVKSGEVVAKEIYSAISHHRLDIVKRYLDSGEIDVNYIVDDEQGRLLHLAAYYGATDIAEFLVKNGADINARRIRTSAATPLHTAIWKKHQDTAIKLLDLGADPSIRLNRYSVGDGISTCRRAWLEHREADMSRVIARLPGCKDAKFDKCRKPCSK